MKTLALILFVLLALVPACMASAQTPAESEQVLITADTQEYIEETNTVVASGNVRVAYQGLILTADKISANLSTQEVLAEGHVTVTQGSRVLCGDRAIYNLQTRLGEVQSARTVVGQIIGTGDRIASFPDRIELYNASVTTCDMPKPDYRLGARRLILYPGRKLRAEGISFYLFERRLFTLPTYSRSLRPGRRSSVVIPRVGSSSVSGFYVNGIYMVNLGRETNGILDIRLSTKQLVQGGIKLDEVLGTRAFFWATYKEEVRARENTLVLLDRTPYTGVAWGPYQMGGRSGVQVDGNVNVGYFHERPTDVTTWRGAGQMRISNKLICLGKDTRVGVSAEVFAAAYDTDDTFSFIKPSVDIAYEPPCGFRGGLTFIDYISAGDAPLLSDEPEIPRELRPRIGYNGHKWGVDAEWRYNLDQQDLYDTIIGVTRHFHCISARVSYATRRSEFGLDVMVLGLGPSADRQPIGLPRQRQLPDQPAPGSE